MCVEFICGRWCELGSKRGLSVSTLQATLEKSFIFQKMKKMLTYIFLKTWFNLLSVSTLQESHYLIFWLCSLFFFSGTCTVCVWLHGLILHMAHAWLMLDILFLFFACLLRVLVAPDQSFCVKFRNHAASVIACSWVSCMFLEESEKFDPSLLRFISVSLCSLIALEKEGELLCCEPANLAGEGGGGLVASSGQLSYYMTAQGQELCAIRGCNSLLEWYKWFCYKLYVTFPE